MLFVSLRMLALACLDLSSFTLSFSSCDSLSIRIPESLPAVDGGDSWQGNTCRIAALAGRNRLKAQANSADVIDLSSSIPSDYYSLSLSLGGAFLAYGLVFGARI